MTKQLLSLLLTLFLLPQLFAQKIYTVETVPNPTLTTTGYVSNPDNLLTPQEVGNLNVVLKEIKDSTTAEVSVVAISSIGEEVPETFSNKLFNFWGIGTKDKNNGLLLIIIEDQHAWRIEVGYGLEGVLPDALCNTIGTNYMVPNFKNGQYGEGIQNGLAEIRKVLENPEYADEINSTLTETETEPDESLIWISLGASFVLVFLIMTVYRSKKKKDVGMGVIGIIPACLGFPFLLLILTKGMEFYALLQWGNYLLLLYIYTGVVAILIRMGRNSSLHNDKADALDNYKKIKQDNISWGFVLLLFPLTFAPYYLWFLFWNLQKKKRFAPRTGKISGKPLRRLGEKEDDKHLRKDQLTEETINSIDYDVWVSDDLVDVEILEYINGSSGYSKCPSCGARTKHLAKSITLRAADYERSGEGKHIYKCKNCNFQKEELYTISKKVRSSSSSGSSGGSYSSGGGSSFGGGSSGGGGSGGKW